MVKSKLTTKAQTTVPRPVRAALDLRPGDELCYEIDGNRVTLTKVPTADLAGDPFRVFTEWSSEADYRAYKDL